MIEIQSQGSITVLPNHTKRPGRVVLIEQKSIKKHSIVSTWDLGKHWLSLRSSFKQPLCTGEMPNAFVRRSRL